MIRRLRRRVVIMSMVSVLVVLTALIGVINIVNFVSTTRNEDRILTMLSDNNGTFPKNFPGSNTESDSGSAPSEDETPPELPTDINAEGEIGGNGSWQDLGTVSQETPYETRYFTVRFNESGSLDSVNTGQIAAVSTDEAIELGEDLLASGKTSGYTGTYRYLITQDEDGTLVIVLDATKDLSSVRSFLLTSALVSLLGACLILLLLIIFSGRMIAPIAESYAKQKTFITNAGHELKTPLAVIESCTEVIEMMDGETKWTSGIHHEVERMTALTGNLVALARMDEDGRDTIRERFDVAAAAGEEIEPYIMLAESHGLKFEETIPDKLEYNGNEKMIRQLIGIFADNAVKYAADGSTVKFEIAARGKSVVIRTVNRADGIPKGKHPEFFERFYRGDTSHNSEKSGYGIGLSMAQAIAEAHGGQTEAVSDGESVEISAKLN